MEASVIRPNRIFTASENIVRYKICNINTGKLQEVADKLVEILL